ncbi:protein ANTAGONIST OF LIKE HETEROCHROMATIN PROTEIN 1-like [Centruroides sculpturatus]|uniref:protein ANTAGONIST OF LIKE HETEROCHROMATIN PROTEIN 1-like n=1 Tax=Centruroides sculpturatus TaxID=218467 RepID=UPI000C6DAB6A|nr:protein ANTAGONIST OF LIKE HETEROCHROMATIN PROTEIN 1-like [Centruroides sculpturatus]
MDSSHFDDNFLKLNLLTSIIGVIYTVRHIMMQIPRRQIYQPLTTIKLLKCLSEKSITIKKQKSPKKRCWKRQTSSVHWEITIPKYTDTYFHIKFHVSKYTFQDILKYCSPYLMKKDTNMRCAIPVEKRVGIAIHVLSNASDYTTIANLYGIGKSTVGKILKEFCDVLCQVLYQQIIKLPSTSSDLDEVVNGFFNQWNFPDVFGCLDGIHIPIMAPKRGYPDDYRNDQKGFSIVLLGLCDHKYNFRYINVGSPGKMSNAEIFENTLLSKFAKQQVLFPKERDLHIVANASFPFNLWLMRPILHSNLSKEEENFNNSISNVLTAIKETFARLKGRWKILMRRCDIKLEDVNKIIVACCILHNICEKNGDAFLNEWYVDNIDNPVLILQNNNEISDDATVKRNKLIYDLVKL